MSRQLERVPGLHATALGLGQEQLGLPFVGFHQELCVVAAGLPVLVGEGRVAVIDRQLGHVALFGDGGLLHVLGGVWIGVLERVQRHDTGLKATLR
ncbi:hypothetical protein D3C71_1759770 [compost metagenome]